MEPDYCHQNLNIQLVSRDNEWLKLLRKLEISRKYKNRLDLMASTQSATQNGKFDIYARKSPKISCETFHGKNYFTQFSEFVYNLLSNFIWGNTFSFLTRSRHLELKFTELDYDQQNLNIRVASRIAEQIKYTLKAYFW